MPYEYIPRQIAQFHEPFTPEHADRPRHAMDVWLFGTRPVAGINYLGPSLPLFPFLYAISVTIPAGQQRWDSAEMLRNDEGNAQVHIEFAPDVPPLPTRKEQIKIGLSDPDDKRGISHEEWVEYTLENWINNRYVALQQAFFESIAARDAALTGAAQADDEPTRLPTSAAQAAILSRAGDDDQPEGFGAPGDEPLDAIAPPQLLHP
jgi:hypothetical protein